ncbi:MAG: 3-dehydroquinate dehydratase [Erysipelothrix sp.]|nr:3-dehydroquinate dehydratase [Erysipelothrix sp.]
MRILVLNGPNLNLLGKREPEIYGTATYNDLRKLIIDYSLKQNHIIHLIQSNHEGVLIDTLQGGINKYDGIVFNPGAFTHTSIALYDTLLAINIPCVEVHLSDIENREAFRQTNYIKKACIASVTNEGIEGYIKAIKILEKRLK